MHLIMKGRCFLGWRMDKGSLGNRTRKELVIGSLIPDTIHFKLKSGRKDKQRKKAYFILIKRAIHRGHYNFKHIHTPNRGALRFIKNNNT